MSCEKTAEQSFSLIHHPAQAGSSCLRRGNGDATQIYQFNYDGFGNTTSIGIGAHNDTNAITLMTYAYGERGEEEANIINGLLTSQTYGNGDKVSFTYDDLGRNKTTTYSDGRVLTYAYTGDGQLYSIHDSKTQYTYVYTYDSIGRLIASCVKSGGTVLMQTRQEYDANNQMTAQHWTVGDTTYSQTFTYNKQEGMVTAMTTGNGHSIQLGAPVTGDGSMC